MPTIKDIARIAGVSHGTVSNVLNGRGNVSVKKIKLVEDAAQKLGYKINLQAKILKEGYAKTVSIILPNITSEQYAYLYDGLFSDLNAQGYELALYLTRDVEELELQFIQQIASKRDSAIITVSCLDNAEQYYQTIKTAKDKIIFVYRKPKKAVQFISLDFEKAGRDVAQVIMDKHYHRVGLFSNSTKNTHSHSFKKGLLAKFKQADYDIDLQHVESIPSDSTYNLAFSFFANHKEKLDAIITSDIDRAHYIRNANYFGSLTSCPQIYTLSGHHFFYEDNFHQYHMNYGMLSKNIVKILLDKPTEQIENKGFLQFSNKLSKNHKKQKEINFLILPSPSTDALSNLLPYFKKVSGIDVNLIVKPFNEIYHLLNQLDQHPYIDIIRIDMAGLSWFADSSLKPLTELNIDLEQLLSHYPKQIVERFTYIHDIAYAVPFDPSIQMLFYRKDLFNDPLIKRFYFEKYRHQLDIPKTFEQFNQITEFFNQQSNPDSPVEFGSCVTLGNTEIVASEFLLRYYAHDGKLIDGEHISLNREQALAVLSEFNEFIAQAKNLEANWWQESVNQFEQGNIAMLIVYMNLFSYMAHKNILPLIGFASVPGSCPLFGGGSLGMSKHSNKNDEVSLFFNWLFSEEISEQIALLGGSIARDNIFQNQQIMNNYPWFNIAQENYTNGVRENHLQNGKSIDLRQVENIVGHHILMWITGQCDSEQLIDNINLELKQKSQQLIH